MCSCRFKDLIEEAFRERKRRRREKLAERVEVELRKIPITFKVRWEGRKYSDYEISVDLTLCIKMSGWPAASNIRRRLNRGHPGYEVFKGRPFLQAGERVKGILERIRSSLKDKDIRSFWVPDYKLFNFRARKSTLTKFCEEKLSNLLQNLTIQSPR